MVLCFLQNVHVHLPNWTGGSDALWDVPGPGDKDGMCLSSISCVHIWSWEVGKVMIFSVTNANVIKMFCGKPAAECGIECRLTRGDMRRPPCSSLNGDKLKQACAYRGLKMKTRCLSTCVLQKKRISVKIEKGTGGMNDVDISWIPQETLNVMSMFIFTVITDFGSCLRGDSLPTLLLHFMKITDTQITDTHSHPVLQTGLPLKHLHGNAPIGQLEQINKALLFHLSSYCPSGSLRSFPSHRNLIAFYNGPTFLESNFH